jgi:hypothetical protein
MPTLSYLHVRGRLAENMVYRPRPGHESARPGLRGEGDPSFQLVLLDADGCVLVGVAPEVRANGCGAATDPHSWRVRGVLPLRPDAAAYELRRGDACLYRTAIAAQPPVLGASYAHPNANGVVLHWQPCRPPEPRCCEPAAPPAAPHCEPTHGGPAFGMTYSVVAAMASGRRITVARGLCGTAFAVDVSTLPVPGKGMLHVVASDGVRSTELPLAPIDVPERAPTLHILSPAEGARVVFGQALSVLGCCLDMGGSPCAAEHAVWALDGEAFATGSMIAALDGLRSGAHRLTLAHERPGADRVACAVTFPVDEPHADYGLWEALMADAAAPPAQVVSDCSIDDAGRRTRRE